MTRKFAFNILYIIDVLGDEDLDSPSDIKINNKPDDITLKSNTASKLFKQSMSKLSSDVRGRVKLKCPLCARNGRCFPTITQACESSHLHPLNSQCIDNRS